MSYALIAVLAVIAAALFVCAVVVGGHTTWSTDYWNGTRIAFFWAGVVFLVGALVLGGIVLSRGLDHRFSRQGCTAYAIQTDRKVKWVDASYFDYGCYVLWNNTWVPRDNYLRLTFGQETGAE